MSFTCFVFGKSFIFYELLQTKIKFYSKLTFWCFAITFIVFSLPFNWMAFNSLFPLPPHAYFNMNIKILLGFLIFGITWLKDRKKEHQTKQSFLFPSGIVVLLFLIPV